MNYQLFGQAVSTLLGVVVGVQFDSLPHDVCNQDSLTRNEESARTLAASVINING